MMHHQLAEINKQQHNHHYAGRPNTQPQTQTRKGYKNISLDVKEDLYRKFQNRLKDSSKSPKEVINQLISFYSMGKINI